MQSACVERLLRNVLHCAKNRSNVSFSVHWVGQERSFRIRYKPSRRGKFSTGKFANGKGTLTLEFFVKFWVNTALFFELVAHLGFVKNSPNASD